MFTQVAGDFDSFNTDIMNLPNRRRGKVQRSKEDTGLGGDTESRYLLAKCCSRCTSPRSPGEAKCTSKINWCRQAASLLYGTDSDLPITLGAPDMWSVSSRASQSLLHAVLAVLLL